MLIIGFLTCRKTTKAVSELAPLAPSGPGYSSNLYNVDNLKLVSMIGQGKYVNKVLHQEMTSNCTIILAFPDTGLFGKVS